MEIVRLVKKEIRIRGLGYTISPVERTSNKKIFTYYGHTALSPDNTTAISWNDTEYRVWNVTNGTVLYKDDVPILLATISYDNKSILIQRKDMLQLIDLERETYVTLESNSSAPYGCKGLFFRNGDVLAYNKDNGKTKLRVYLGVHPIETYLDVIENSKADVGKLIMKRTIPENIIITDISSTNKILYCADSKKDDDINIKEIDLDTGKIKLLFKMHQFPWCKYVDNYITIRTNELSLRWMIKDKSFEDYKEPAKKVIIDKTNIVVVVDTKEFIKNHYL